MHWIHITEGLQLDSVSVKSQEKPQVIFKHSIRCPTSSLAFNRLQKAAAAGVVDFYFLDLINYRHLSQLVADRFGIEHESPQVLLIKGGECIYHESHLGIDYDDLMEQVNEHFSIAS